MVCKKFGDMRDIIVTEDLDLSPCQRPRSQDTGVAQLISDEQIVRSDQGRNDPEIGQIAGAEDTGIVRSLQRAQPRFEFVRTIAVARIMMPESMVRLSAGRETMSDEIQALCFLAGANSIFVGPKLLTTDNPERDRDDSLFDRLGIESMPL